MHGVLIRRDVLIFTVWSIYHTNDFSDSFILVREGGGALVTPMTMYEMTIASLCLMAVH